MQSYLHPRLKLTIIILVYIYSILVSLIYFQTLVVMSEFFDSVRPVRCQNTRQIKFDIVL